MKKSRKYIVLVGDGMADYPIPELSGKTPLDVARTPNMDRIASCRIGRAQTIPDGMDPGSDVANLSLLGYNPRTYHTGRAPFEASSMGIKLKPDETAYRMNLITLNKKSSDEIIMVSHSSGDISTGEAVEIVNTLKQEMKLPNGISIYPGVAYRHLMVSNMELGKVKTIPPHDVLDKNMAIYLNHNEQKSTITDLIRRSWDILENHPINLKRRQKNLPVANSIWLWGEGKAPLLPLFSEKFGLTGGVISAVDLLKGIGIYAGLMPCYVEGATGYLDTNYYGKAEKALSMLEHHDFMFVHVEAPDEAGHNGNLKEKIQAIENFDSKVVGTILNNINQFDDIRIMVASDHFTPICKKTHTTEPTPFAWAGKKELENLSETRGFTEKFAFESSLFFENGYDLMSSFLQTD